MSPSCVDRGGPIYGWLGTPSLGLREFCIACGASCKEACPGEALVTLLADRWIEAKLVHGNWHGIGLMIVLPNGHGDGGGTSIFYRGPAGRLAALLAVLEREISRGCWALIQRCMMGAWAETGWRSCSAMQAVAPLDVDPDAPSASPDVVAFYAARAVELKLIAPGGAR